MSNVGFLVYKHTVLNPMSRAQKYADKDRWVTVAEWPDGTISTDNHDTEAQAQGVSKLLMKEGNELGKPRNVVILSPQPGPNKPFKLSRKMK